MKQYRAVTTIPEMRTFHGATYTADRIEVRHWDSIEEATDYAYQQSHPCLVSESSAIESLLVTQ